MKKIIRSLIGAAMLIAASIQTHAQGLVYDQQSATGPVPVVGNGNADGLYIQEDSPLMQSFTPSLSAIGFLQLEFEDVPGNGNNGATVYVNLWTGSPNTRLATLLGSTTSVYMPNEFATDNLFVAGITNFNFSTLIALIPGQTYYLQPVVLSGDDPWAIVTIGDTYPNGQLYGKTGGYFQPSTDFWFREGVVVPEPSTLALVGLSGLLAFAFKRRSKLAVLLLFSVSILSVHAAEDSVVQATADAAGLTQATALPDSGTFWIMTVDSEGNLIESPYPALPDSLSTLPIYSVTNDIYMVDDTGGQLAPASARRMSSEQAASIAQTQAATTASLIEQIVSPADEGDQPNGFTPMIYTSGLWLEILNTNPVTANLWLRLHGTVDGDNYQLLSTTNLTDTNWDLGQILNATDVQMDFSPVPITNSMTLFRAHHANPVMYIYNAQDSEEPNPTNSDPGQIGIFYIINQGWQTNDIPVYYTIGGTAQNGVDYSNLTGVVTMPVDQGYAEIDINPIADGLKPNQTIILTLLQNTNYLINPGYYSATNNLIANPQVYPVANGDLQRPCPNMQFYYTLQAQDPRNLPLTYTILTHPIHGTLTGTPPNVTYTATNCYEGQDSFTFTASDGQYAATGTVTLVISDPVYAYPFSVQTCRGTPVSFTPGSDQCSEILGYALLSNPAHGTVSGTATNLTYTPTGTSFTGTDTFNYIVYSGCGGDFATNSVTITVGDVNVYPNPQSVMAGTNRPVNCILSAGDYDSCKADTNYYTYTETSNPTNGTLSGSGASLVYTPNHNYEGMDSFQFNASDGVWPSTYSDATITIYTVGGPVLTNGITCNPFGTAEQLNWSLDETVSNMVQQDGLIIKDFIIYRSTNSGGPYTPIYITADASQTNYQDDTALPGQTNYYVVTFESPESGVTYESPFSNKTLVAAEYPDDFIPPNAIWNVVTNLSNPTNVVALQAPFSSFGTNQYPGIYPLPNSYWPPAPNGSVSTWSNYISLFIPSNSVPLAQVQYAIAIDNDYKLYLNDPTNYIDMTNHQGPAAWPSFRSFNSVAPNRLRYGTNDLRVVIVDEATPNYFSMVVTTNTCGQ